MLKKVDPVYLLTYADNTILHIPIGTLLDKLSADTWSDIHRYKNSFLDEFAIGKISETYVGWVKMPIDNKLLDKFLERYFVNSEIKLLCDFDCNANDALYIIDTYVKYNGRTIYVKLNKDKNGIQLCNWIGSNINRGELTTHQSVISVSERIYCVYIREKFIT